LKPDTHNKWMEAELGNLEGIPTETQSAPPKTSTGFGTVWDILYVLVRIGVSLAFAFRGAQKLFGVFGGDQVQQDHTTLAMGVLEFFGGVVLAIGVYTRPVALLLFIEAAWVYYKLCPLGTYWPIPTGGELPLAFAAYFLFLAAFGPGNISIDQMKRRG
jgi:putative oxidoreductase